MTDEHEEKTLTEQAWELIGPLDPGMTREERDAKFRPAADETSSIGGPNVPGNEANPPAEFSPLHEEIHRLWTEDVDKFPPKGTEDEEPES